MEGASSCLPLVLTKGADIAVVWNREERRLPKTQVRVFVSLNGISFCRIPTESPLRLVIARSERKCWSTLDSATVTRFFSRKVEPRHGNHHHGRFFPHQATPPGGLVLTDTYMARTSRIPRSHAPHAYSEGTRLHINHGTKPETRRTTDIPEDRIYRSVVSKSIFPILRGSEVRVGLLRNLNKRSHFLGEDVM